MGGILGGLFKKKVVSESVTGVLHEANNIIDTLGTSDEEKLAAKHKLAETSLKYTVAAIEAQKEIVSAEASGNKLQRSWRPILMLSFGFIVVFKYFVWEVLRIFWTDLPDFILVPEFWALLKMGIGGYVVGRSVEKVTGSVMKNIDITMLRKKDRKEALE